jgi:hypothetical protein
MLRLARVRHQSKRQVASLFGDGQALAKGQRHVSELVETRQSLRRSHLHVCTSITIYRAKKTGPTSQGQLTPPDHWDD